MPPGGEGKITLKVNTTGYGGRKLSKNVQVFTNDSAGPQLNLVITGDVDKFVTITPRHANLMGYIGEQIKSTVIIIPERKYAFKILNVRAKNGSNIKFQLAKEQGQQITQYALTVENLKQEQGRYFDTIILETDSNIQPKLEVRVFANIRPRQAKKVQ
ncbi:MAG: hypothetical protein JSW39_29345 [Desulfobacterales bacterium]|nr:MAG: hypothetical protein JSW39_29345 [Desulfobacterales bacterium]